MSNKADNRSAIEKAVARIDRGESRRVESARPQAPKVVEPLPVVTPKVTAKREYPKRPMRTDKKKATVMRHNAGSTKLSMEGLITIENPNPQAIAEFRRIKRPLIAKAFGKGVDLIDRGNLIMVTSAMPNEGKTNTAINLARSIAMERNYTVLLIDADAAMSSVSRMYGLYGQPGLTDLLLDSTIDPGDVMVRTDFPDLVVLPAGKRHEHAAELMASDEMETLLDELSTRYSDRILVFDTPPLLATSEAPVLAKHVGQIVVVIEADKTRQHVVQNALAELDQSKEVGLVLNKCRTKPHTHGYYGYSYGYGEQS